MPTFRVTCVAPGGSTPSQLLIDAEDGPEAHKQAEKVLKGTAVVILVQPVPADTTTAQLRNIETHLTNLNKSTAHMARKIFGHWTLFYSIVLALLIFVPVFFFIAKLVRTIFPFLFTSVTLS